MGELNTPLEIRIALLQIDWLHYFGITLESVTLYSQRTQHLAMPEVKSRRIALYPTKCRALAVQRTCWRKGKRLILTILFTSGHSRFLV